MRQPCSVANPVARGRTVALLVGVALAIAPALPASAEEAWAGDRGTAGSGVGLLLLSLIVPLPLPLAVVAPRMAPPAAPRRPAVRQARARAPAPARPPG